VQKIFIYFEKNNIMKIFWKTKSLLLLLTSVIIISCGKEDALPPDNLIGEWNVYSISNNTDPVIIWEDLKASVVALIPAYSCMEFTTVATEQIVTTRYVFIDQNSAGCRNPVISAYTWSKDSESGLYNFTQGNNIVQYSITFSNNDNRMTWIDQTSGDTTIWDRQVAAVTVTE
jgi:hypothetical protein